MTDDERRLAKIHVTGEFITDMFRDKNHITVVVEDGLPPDAEFRRIEWSGTYDFYELIVWSSEFDPVPEGGHIPEMYPTFKDIEVPA